MRALIVSVAFSAALAAQDSARRAPVPGRIRGRVVADSGRTPIEGAQVSIRALNRTVRTDSLGRYDIPNLIAGRVQVVVRAIGFRDDSTTLGVRDRSVVNLELRLAFEDIVVTRAGAAAVAPVVMTSTYAPPTPDRMAEFNARKQEGIGRFLERTDIAKWTGRRTPEMLDALGGLKVEKSGMYAAATNGQQPAPTCTLCRSAIADTVDPGVIAPAARQSCYMDVYVDGVIAYQAGVEPPEPVYDLNGISPDGIEAIEVYRGVTQVPPKFASRRGSGCGVLVIWTRTRLDKKP